MSGLPPGWEWDYDGARWFYRYKPNGHVQFHFPKEGDEFPDFIDSFAPALELAPEEKLESQQQLKRRTAIDVDLKSKMRATGGPLSDFAMNRSGFGGPLNDDDDGGGGGGGGFFFQPENFMYMGPDAYTDISPDADEDDRDALSPKKAADDDAGGNTTKNKALLDAVGETSGVSPLQSETNTPSVVNSVPVQEAIVVQGDIAAEPPVELPLIRGTQDLLGPTNVAAASPDVPRLDSAEKPRQGHSSTFQPPPWDPVGNMAEMATEHTAPAHIETHPDPVEMADNAVLAPIEIPIADFGIAELPERTSPSEPRPLAQSTHDLLHQTNMSDKALYGATFGTGSRSQKSSPTRASQVSPGFHPEAVQPGPKPGSSPSQKASQQTQMLPADANNNAFAIKRKPSNSVARQSQYQPYVPGVTGSVTRALPSREPNFKPRDHSNSLSREMSLMMGPRPNLDQASTPSVLQPPRVPPKVPFQPNQPSTHQDAGPASLSMHPSSTQGSSAGTGVGQSLDGSSYGGLQHVPSVLKPARGQLQGQPQQSLPLPPPSSAQGPSNPRHSISGPSPSSQPTSKAPTGRIVENVLRYTAFQPGGMNTQESHVVQATQRPALPQSQSQYLSATRGPELPLVLRPPAHRVETAPPQSSTDQQRPPLSHYGSSNRSAPPLPDFLQRPRAQSDVRQQQSSSSQNRAYLEFALNSVTRGMQSSDLSSPPPNLELARQTSYASSEVSSLGPLTGGQSSAPLQTPSPLGSDGRRSSSGFLCGTHSDSSSRSTPGPAGQSVPERPAGSRPTSFSRPPLTAQTEAAKQTTSRRFPMVPQKIPISTSTSNIQQVSGQQTPGSASSSASSRRHSLPPHNLASLAARPPSQEAPPGPHRLSGQSHDQPHIPFNQVQRSGSVEETIKASRNVSRSEPLPDSQPRLSENQYPTPPPLGSQSPHPAENGRSTVQFLSERPMRPTVILPSQHMYGSTSPSTPIRSPGHVLHSIQEHLENDNSIGTPAAASISVTSRENRRYSQGSSLNLSTASAYPSSAESSRGYSAERLMNQVAQRQANVQKPISEPLQSMNSSSLPSHPDYSPVTNNPFQPYSPINMSGAPFQNVVRPGSTPPVMQTLTKDKDKGGWLSKLMKGNKASVLQKQPTQPSQQQQFRAVHNPPQVAPPPSNILPQQQQQQQQQQFQRLQHLPPAAPPINMHNPHGRADTHLHDKVVDKLAASITADNPERSMFGYVAPVPPNLSIQLIDEAVSQGKGFSSSSHQPFHRQDTPLQQEPYLATTSQLSTEVAVQQPNEVEERPTNVPPVGLVPPAGPPKDQTSDNLSDAASVSTMDVSEVQIQPVLKPQLVTVGKQAIVPSKQQQDSLVQAAAPMQKSHLPSTIHIHNDARVPAKSDLFVAPLFSKPHSQTAVSTVPVNVGPGPQDRWAKRPAVDYSGDDWGDDPWDYK
ncbi:hypothetical protein CGRA01v4_03949 [Colletotrichum graminicola]|uniref:WW domain-containing protein n=1 Tax=Colletotrichum graminicola (strain M1.001 / M2 / FGSC 10212) TaxID=645133 RepID=E3QTR7_COLGM|nr:uncharacterized protein GLRG_09373 [Colletotrichum graminicola M1.001]EFQ34229.1 hypothetical protein GLRG_09373 [Colletotrichum graminicola M1.001]WDK12669.1 hypothetical protein CGRA01v4_03949 [Colletotrichum graminicola]